MYIPVSLANGATFVDCEVDVSGALVAECAVRYEGQDYAPGVEIQVERTKTVRLSTTVSEYTEISVVLAGKQHYWYVDLPKSLRYVAANEYKSVTGTTYGGLLNTQTQTSRAFTPTETFTGGDASAAIDFVKKDIWFFNTNNEVKKLTIATQPIAVLFVPRWSAVDGVTTTCYIATVSQLLQLDSSFNVAETFEVESGVVAASGDVNGNIVLAYAGKLVRWKDNAVLSTIVAPDLTAIHSLFVTPSNDYLVGCASGLVLSSLEDGIWFTTTINTYVGRYWAFDINDTFLYAVDAGNRLIAKISLVDFTYTPVYFDKVPRDVVADGDDVYVSFLNDATAKRFNKELTTSQDVTALKSFGAAFLGDYLVTDLYSDAADVTLAEPAVTEAVTLVDSMPRAKETQHQWIVDWARPEFVRLGTTDVVMRVNGTPFTSGYLRSGDLVTFTIPATSEWYFDRNVSLIGRRAVTFRFRTVPKLYPDTVTLPSVLEAFLKVEYLESFVVAGMTYGFTATVSAGSPELLFSVNGGAFGTTGTIKNDDVVEVSVRVTSLISRRTAHDIVVDGAEQHVASTWTVLPMALNGVTKRDTSEVLKSRFGELHVQSAIETLEPFTPTLSPYVTIGYDTAQWELAGDCEAFTTQYGCTKHSQATVGISDVSQWFINSKEASFSKTSEVQHVRYSHVVSTNAAYSVNASAVTFLGNTEFALVESGTVLSVNGVYAIAAQFAGAKLSAAYGIAAQISSAQLSAEYSLVSDEARLEIEADYAHVPAHTRLGVEVDYAHVPAYTRLGVAADWVRPAGAERHLTEAIYQVFESGERAPVPASYALGVKANRTMFEAQSSLSWRYPMSEIETQMLRRVSNGTYVIAGLYDVREATNVLEFSASVVLRPSVEHYGVHTVFERYTSSTRFEVQQNVERRTSNTMLVDRPAVEFIHSQRTGYQLSEEASAFFTSQEDAEAYATSINLSAGVVYKQINGKWVFTLAPTASTATCSLGELPPTALRRFGYVGGG